MTALKVSASTPGRYRLFKAMQKGLTRGERVDTMVLDAINPKVADLDIAGSLTRANIRLVRHRAASTLELDILDPSFAVERSGILTRDGTGRLSPLRVAVDDIGWRLQEYERPEDSPTVTLTFEDESWALNRLHGSGGRTAIKRWSRGTRNRAQVIADMMTEPRQKDILFVCPEFAITPKVAAPEYPDTAPAPGETGFDDDAELKLGGITLDSSQKRIAATILEQARIEGAPPRATLALVCAAIGESTLSHVVNKYGYGGVLGGDVSYRYHYFKATDDEAQAHYFLRGGKGYQGGGAIALAAAHPDWGPGLIAVTVEGSRSNFTSDAAAEQHYGQHADDARAIIAAYATGAGDPVTHPKDSAEYVASYQFTRGLPNRYETNIDASIRLAEEVDWDLFSFANVVVYASEYQLLSTRARFTFNGFFDRRLKSTPGVHVASGALADRVTFKVDPDSWAYSPGMCGVLRNMGPASGRLLVDEFEWDLITGEPASITLGRATPAKDEPAPQIRTRQLDDQGRPTNTTPDSGSTDGAKGDVTTNKGNGDFVAQTTRPDGKRVLPNTWLSDFLALLAGRVGRTIETNTYSRHSQLSSSGKQSDHWTGNAADLHVASNYPDAGGTQLAYEAFRMCGLSVNAARAKSTSGGQYDRFTWHGPDGKDYSVQVLWGDNVDHVDHVHIGVRPA